MSSRATKLACLLLSVLTIIPAFAAKALTAAEAKNHIGEQSTVCGKVMSAHYAETTRGRPTFLNFDEPYPNQIFTVVIWGTDRSKFDNPETAYRGQSVCVSGIISSYRGVPEIVIRDKTQISSQ